MPKIEFNLPPTTDIAWDDIPIHCRDGLYEYIKTGCPVGGFLTAVLENDLYRAADRADLLNRRALAHYVIFLYSYAPKQCFGTKEAVDAWIKRGGLDGKPD